MFSKFNKLNKLNKQITLFASSKFTVSLNKLHLIQGIVVFVLLFVGFFSMVSFLNPKKQIAENQIIKSIVVKQTSAIVAQGSPVTWSILVNKSDITKNQKYIKLPKNATNIRQSIVTKTQAQTIIAKATPIATTTDKQRTQFAKAHTKSFVAKLASYLLASLEEGAVQVVEQITEAVAPTLPNGSAEQALTIETKDATVVDLSAEASASVLPEQDSSETKPAENSETSDVSPTTANTIEQNTLDFPVLGNDTTSELESAQTGVSELPVEALAPALPEAPAPTEVPVLNTVSQSDQSIVESETKSETKTEEVQKDQVVKIDYQTPAPTITEQEKENSKIVTVSVPSEITTPDNQTITPQYTNVLAHSTIPEIYKVGQEDKIKIKWKSNNNQAMEFHAYDTNNNGKLDYVEWTVPHLSEQIFEIIFISKAWQLDQNQEITADIYDQVKTEEGTWQENTYATIPQDNYIRVTFNQILDNTKDITIHARPTPGAVTGAIEVYPVYTNADGTEIQGPKIAQFPEITSENTYKIYLTSLQAPTDKFDLRVVAGE